MLRPFTIFAALSTLLLVLTAGLWWMSFRQFPLNRITVRTTPVTRKGMTANEGAWFYNVRGQLYLMTLKVTWIEDPDSTNVAADPTVNISWLMHHRHLMIVFAFLPVLWVVQRLTTRKARQGHCPVCGYDMRASPHRCPECGHVPSTY
jgi:hypothetical protein